MPRVEYIRVAQGFRPYTNPRPLAGLRGLGALKGGVSDQSIATYQAIWPQDANFSFASTIIDSVSTALQANDGISVLSSTNQNSPVGAFQGKAYSVVLQVQVRNGMGFGASQDLASVIDHEFYVVTGKMPLASSITSVGSGPSASPTLSSTDPNCVAGMPYDLNGNPCAAPSLTSWFEQNALWIGLGIAAVVVLPKFL